MTTLSRPVVLDFPIVKISLASKALCSRWHTSSPSAFPGK